MRVHDVTDWLVGDQLLRFRDVRETTRLGLSGLKHHDVVLELHNHRIVTAGSSGEPVEAVAELFGSDHQRSGRTTSRSATSAATAGRCGCRSQRCDIGRIRLRRRHRDFKVGPPTARLHDLRRRYDSTEVLPTRVGGEDVHVAHDVVTQPCLDPIDDVLFVHVAVDDVVLAGRRLDRRTPGQDGVVLAVDLAAARGRVVRSRAFQETPGRDVKLQGVGPGLRDIRLLGRDLLEKRSGHRDRCAATRRIVRRSRMARRRGRQVDHADVVVDRPHRIMGAPGSSCRRRWSHIAGMPHPWRLPNT